MSSLTAALPLLSRAPDARRMFSRTEIAAKATQEPHAPWSLTVLGTDQSCAWMVCKFLSLFAGSLNSPVRYPFLLSLRPYSSFVSAEVMLWANVADRLLLFNLWISWSAFFQLLNLMLNSLLSAVSLLNFAAQRTNLDVSGSVWASAFAAIMPARMNFYILQCL